MNIRCFFGHKWSYKNEEVSGESLDSGWNSGYSIKKYKVHTRTCERCYLKEIRGLTWIKYDGYTKEEMREIKLNEIIGS